MLQRQRTGDARDMSVEIATVRAAASAGVPVAAIVAASTDASLLDGALHDPDATSPGRRPLARSFATNDSESARQLLPSQLAEALVKIHAIDPAQVPGLVAVDQVEHYRQVLDTWANRIRRSSWRCAGSRRNRPPVTGHVVVHGDFRLGNLMVGDEGLRAVLDWELAHVGDPMEDLGWLCVKSWRFGSPLPGRRASPSTSELFAAYEAAGGGAVDPRCRSLVGGARHDEVGHHVHRPGQRPPQRRDAQPRARRHRSPGVRERARPVPGHGRPLVKPHDAPSAAQLVEAVREWLQNEVHDEHRRPPAVSTRVWRSTCWRSSNASWRWAAFRQAAHVDRLRRLGVADDAALAAAIRSGELDDRLEEVRALVWQSVRDKLAVANPKYLASP